MIIALFGKAGSGKDTVADMIAERHESISRVSFADGMKLAVYGMGLASHHQLYGPSERRGDEIGIPCDPDSCIRCGAEAHELRTQEDGCIVCKKCNFMYPPIITVRLLLTTIGTEWGRRLNKGLWPLLVTNKLKVYTGDSMVTDGRFYNEKTAIQDAGGITVSIYRGHEIGRAPDDMHPSEVVNHEDPLGMNGPTDSRPHNYLVKNLGSLEDLRAAVGELMTIVEDRFRTGAHVVDRSRDSDLCVVGAGELVWRKPRWTDGSRKK